MSEYIDWDELAGDYNESLSHSQGRPTKEVHPANGLDVRLATNHLGHFRCWIRCRRSGLALEDCAGGALRHRTLI